MMETRPRNGVITKYNKPFIEQRADPYVYRHTDGSYYFTASVPEYDKIILRKSDTLTGLSDAEEKCIWTKHESGDMSKHIWAPELHYIDGKMECDERLQVLNKHITREYIAVDQQPANIIIEKFSLLLEQWLRGIDSDIRLLLLRNGLG